MTDFLQRPSARELLKHKFIKSAKKTSYLTELIERLERWKQEGGEKHDEERQESSEDEWVFPYSVVPKILKWLLTRKK